MEVIKKIGDSVIIAEQSWRAAEHILGVSFPTLQDSKLILRALEHMDKSLRETISAILKLEHLTGKVILSKSGRKNIESFFNICTKEYGIMEEDVRRIQELLDFGRRHKASGMEFAQKGKMIIFDDDKGTIILSAEILEKILPSVRKLQLELRKRIKAFSRKL